MFETYLLRNRWTDWNNSFLLLWLGQGRFQAKKLDSGSGFSSGFFCIQFRIILHDVNAIIGRSPVTVHDSVDAASVHINLILLSMAFFRVTILYQDYRKPSRHSRNALFSQQNSIMWIFVKSKILQRQIFWNILLKFAHIDHKRGNVRNNEAKNPLYWYFFLTLSTPCRAFFFVGRDTLMYPLPPTKYYFACQCIYHLFQVPGYTGWL